MLGNFDCRVKFVCGDKGVFIQGERGIEVGNLVFKLDSVGLVIDFVKLKDYGKVI